MINQKRTPKSTTYSISIKGPLALIILAIVAFCWIGNIVKFAQCDFDPKQSWKGEIIHGAGIIVPLSLVTFWFEDK